MAQPDPTQWVAPERRPLLDAYAALLKEWNQRVNLVARSSEHQILSQHIPHALCLAWRAFPAGASVVDWGTGGGLPAVPLAIAFPDTAFVAVDSIGKKTAALRMMTRDLGLDNVEVWQGRAEQFDGTAEYFVSRATAPLVRLWKWSARASAPASTPPEASPREYWRPGLVCLKGGDLAREIRQVKRARVEQIGLEQMAGHAYAEKYILHVESAPTP